jgi:beta-phosphoglucomutase family hydrolase
VDIPKRVETHCRASLLLIFVRLYFLFSCVSISYFCDKSKYVVLKKLSVDNRAKGLIFDLDGTIADTMPVHFIVYRNILAQYGVDFTPEVFDTLAGVPAIGTFERINEMYGLRLDAFEMGHFKERTYEKMMHLIKPIDPVVEIIHQYHGKLPMSVGTGGYTRLAWKTLSILGLDKFFHILVSSEDVTHHKPHPETFLRCAELMGVEPGFCQVFEDGRLGIQAAETAGMMAVNVTQFYTVTLGNT